MVTRNDFRLFICLSKNKSPPKYENVLSKNRLYYKVICFPTVQIWCAAGVNLTGGRTKDGGSIVGGSVFYDNPPETEPVNKDESDVGKLDQELKVRILNMIVCVCVRAL